MPLRRDATASDGAEPAHGQHTLRVWRGTIVGIHKDDVFVELGPRMQGVLSLRRFETPPAPGEQHDFTLLGMEAGLWALARVEEGLVASWQTMEVASWVQARATGTNPGGLELKIGPLHAFMPKSETGLERSESPRVLVGKTLTCEVLEIDRERQRVLVSRKRVLQKQRTSERTRETGRLAPGMVIQGRVHRLEAFGAFVRFGSGLEGLIHVSNLSDERVEHPSQVLTEGQLVEAKVLTIRRGGKRIGLGLKQMHESPWKALERTHFPGQIVAGQVTRAHDFGVFVRIAPGIEGLLSNSATGFPPGRPARQILRLGQELVCRLVELDVEAERLALSLLHPDGSRVQPEELLSPEARAALQANGSGTDGATTSLGRLLDRALQGWGAASARSDSPTPARAPRPVESPLPGEMSVPDPVPHPDAGQATRLLLRLREGDGEAGEELLGLLYRELHGLASALMRGERAGHTLQPTALVHEAWLRLVPGRAGASEAAEAEGGVQDRGHFLRLAGRAMRRVLVDHARRRGAGKREAGREALELDEHELALWERDPGEILGIDETLARLERVDAEAAHIVELRFFAGLTVEETATALGRSARQIEGGWVFARGWLRRELARGDA